MLENADLKQRLKKRDYQERMPRLEIKLAQLQRRAKQPELPVIIVVAGWDASGKGALINKLVLALDPRGYDVYALDGPDQKDGSRPFLWRFWTRIPMRGRLAVLAEGGTGTRSTTAWRSASSGPPGCASSTRFVASRGSWWTTAT